MFNLRKDEPIWQHWTDTDFYKETMGLLIWMLHRDVPVKFQFKCRTPGVNWREIIDLGRLREEFDAARRVHITKSEQHYLRGTNEYGERMFPEEYLVDQELLSLPQYYIGFSPEGELEMGFPGGWFEATRWEIPALTIVSELVTRYRLSKLSRFEQDALFAEGRLRLKEKIRKLRQYPELMFSDFGTRRRALRAWQEYVVGVLAEELPRQFRGTSNTFLANKFALLPMGTSAHELYMAYYGIYYGSDGDIRQSHNRVLQDWWNLYGQGLSIALTDTYGTDFFFRDMTEEQARNWKGLRQDSGPPQQFIDRTQRFYDGLGIKKEEKLLLFSDGLDVDKMISLHLSLQRTFLNSYGWGTGLTNDLTDNPLFKPLSMVVKLMEANGHRTVKLSDNIRKAMGPSQEIERAKRIFGYTEDFAEDCRY